MKYYNKSLILLCLSALAAACTPLRQNDGSASGPIFSRQGSSTPPPSYRLPDCAAPPAAPAPQVASLPPAVIRPPDNAPVMPQGARILSPAETVVIEHEDRIARLNRLAALQGVQRPNVETGIVAPVGSIPGVSWPIPVVRITFSDRAFFDFNIDAPRPQSLELLRVIAENMRREAPDVHLMVVGHTDSRGTDAYNEALSRRRAINVMHRLADLGVRGNQMSAIPMGEQQPVADNASDEGRALNRRVEFYIAANREANFQVVALREINADWLNGHEPRGLNNPNSGETTVAARVTVLEINDSQTTASVAPPVEQTREIVLRQPRVQQTILRNETRSLNRN